MQNNTDKSPNRKNNDSQSIPSSENLPKPHNIDSVQEKDTMDTGHSTNAQKTREHTQSIIFVIILQLILGGCFLIMGMIYGWMHKIPSVADIIAAIQGKGVESYYDAFANFNFVGISENMPNPSIFAVICEVGVWSFFGVLARSEYYLTQLIIRQKKIQLLETISKIIGETAMGVFTAVAVVAFLWSTEFVNLTLRTADIGSIMAISFILGFYHENTRRLLGSFHKMVATTSHESKESEEGKKTPQNII